MALLLLPVIAQGGNKGQEHKTSYYYDHEGGKVVTFSISPSKHGHFYNYRIWKDGKPENYSVRIRPDEKDYFVDEHGHKRKMNYYEKKEREADK